MSADEFVIERTSFVIGPEGLFDGGKYYGTAIPGGVNVLDGFHQKFGNPTRGQPLHFGGCSLHFSNFSPTPVEISLWDSVNGVTVVPLPFSTAGLSGLLVYALAGLSQVTLVTTTAFRYFAIRIAPPVAEGVRCDMTQYPPRGHEAGAAAYGS